MAAYKLEVIRRGYIIVDDVEDLEHAEEYIENCNPVNEVHWSDFLETTPRGTELEVVYIPDTLTVRELAEKMNIPINQLLKYFSVNGKTVKTKTVIKFKDAAKIADDYNVLFKRIK